MNFFFERFVLLIWRAHCQSLTSASGVELAFGSSDRRSTAVAHAVPEDWARESRPHPRVGGVVRAFMVPFCCCIRVWGSYLQTQNRKDKNSTEMCRTSKQLERTSKQTIPWLVLASPLALVYTWSLEFANRVWRLILPWPHSCTWMALLKDVANGVGAMLHASRRCGAGPELTGMFRGARVLFALVRVLQVVTFCSSSLCTAGMALQWISLGPTLDLHNLPCAAHPPFTVRF